MFAPRQIASRFSPPQRDNNPADAAILSRLNAVRFLTVVMIGIGYASTMAVGPQSKEWLHVLGHDPSWYGIQVLFFLSGWLAWRSLSSGRGVAAFIRSRALRNLPWVILYTLIVSVVLYPLLCNHDSPAAQGALQLALYFFKTVTLVDPGGPLPGALDDALYACLLQGTIWTLRWGVVAFAGLILIYATGMRTRTLIGLLALCIAAHIAIGSWSLRTESTAFDPLVPGLRLGYAFLFGAVMRSVNHVRLKSWRGWLAISATCLGLATLHYVGLTWTHMIEVLASLGWCALAMALLLSPLAGLRRWPNLTLPTYLGIWPVAQWLLSQHPDISVPTLVLATVSISVGLALFLRGLLSLSVSPAHRRVQTA
ncbi:hypothetical protein ACFFUB_04535 [Algimonas porphyrae]|uniref:Acyltransferase n=1 Tax=Algimonas porphyrae TaxID=1128113 RepID=A0ABQ5UYX7_9PROT|nr:hypothetical protein [Algimonas porphyrae]GLQ19960.1 hypothetical protein GCM10007854_09150 [Algimonas porphyrae]